MSCLVTLTKMNVRLLFRNKGVWAVFIMLPLSILLLLNINWESEEKQLYYTNNQVNELEQAESDLLYLSDEMRYIVKVYDSSDAEVSDWLLQKLADMGMFEIYRYDAREMSFGEIVNQITESVSSDRVGTYFHIKSDFTEKLLAGEPEQGVTLYQGAKDDRQELFEEAVQNQLKILMTYAPYAQNQETKLKEVLEEALITIPEKEIKTISTAPSWQMSQQQKNARTNISLSFAVLALAFALGGVFIAHTVIEERENSVLTRIALCDVTKAAYMGSKLVISLIATIFQTAVIAIGFRLLLQISLGLRYTDYILIIFLLGFICNVCGLCVGILVGNVMSANFAVFLFWMFSTLVAGLYFPAAEMTGLLRVLAGLTPQKWFLNIAEMLLLQQKGGYTLMVLVTISFLMVTASIGAVGMQMKERI